MRVTYRELARFPGYRVGDDGTVWSSRNSADWKMMAIVPERRGYQRLKLCQGGKHVTVYVHALVLEAFEGPKPDGMEACHCNGIKSDNRLSNLRWDTRSSNNADRIRHGGGNAGERQGGAKLTDENVRKIRSMKGAVSQAALASQFGVCQTSISHIQRGKTWTHI